MNVVFLFWNVVFSSRDLFLLSVRRRIFRYEELRELLPEIPESVKALPLSHDMPTLNPALVPFLEVSVSALINEFGYNSIKLAMILADAFNYNSKDATICYIIGELSSGNISWADVGKELGSSSASGFQVFDGIEHLPDVDKFEVIASECSQRVEPFCRQTRVFHEIAEKLGEHVSVVVQSSSDIVKLLERLFTHSHPAEADFDLCKDLLQCCQAPDPHVVANILASRFVDAQRHSQTEWPSHVHQNLVRLCSNFQKPLADALLERLPSFRARSSDFFCGLENLDGTNEDLSVRTLPFESEVEVIILAYSAYVLDCAESRIADLLEFVQIRCRVFASYGRFGLLSRLLLTIPEYHSLTTLFRLLVHHDELEILLSQVNVAASPMSLKTAVVCFLRAEHSQRFDLLVHVHMRLGLGSQLAPLLQDRADDMAKSLCDWEDICIQRSIKKSIEYSISACFKS